MVAGWRQRYSSRKNLLAKTLQVYSQKPELKAYLELFLSLATISIFGIFAIRPTIITIGKLLKEIKAKEETVNTMNQKIDNLKTANENFNKNKDKIEIAKMSIPNEALPHLLIRQIEANSYDTSVRLSTLSISGVDLLGKINENVAELPVQRVENELDETSQEQTAELAQRLENEEVLTFSLTVKGEFNNLINFIAQLENLRRPIKLNEIGLSKILEEENTSTLQLSLGSLSLPFLRSK